MNSCNVSVIYSLQESDPQMTETCFTIFKEHPQETVWTCVFWQHQHFLVEVPTSLKSPKDQKHAYSYLSNEGLNRPHWKR